MSSWFAGALLQGIGAGGAAYGKSMAEEAAQQRRDEEQRRREEAQVARDRERERAADEREQTRIAARTSAGGGSGGGGGGAGGPMLPERVDAAMLNIEPNERAIRSGSFFDRAREVELAGPPEQLQGPGDAGYKPAGSTTETYRAEGWERLQAEKVKVLDELRTAMNVGTANYDDLQKGRQTSEVTDALKGYRAGNERDGQAALIGQGKDVYGGTKEVVRNNVTGGSEMTRLGEEEVKESRAKAAELRAKAEELNARANLRGVKTERLSSELNSVNNAISDLTDFNKQPRSSASAEEKKAHADSLAMFRALQSKIGAEMQDRGIAPPPAPRASEPGPAPQPTASELNRRQPPAPAAARPASRFASTPQEMDRPAILQDELNKARQRLETARTPEERTRAEQDILGAQRELGRLPGGGNLMQRAAGQAPAAPAPAPRPAPEPAKSPYADGTRLRGPGGKTYIVRNGKPEPL